MRTLLLAIAGCSLALSACAVHHRATLAPTMGVRHGATAGGELTGEAAVGDEDLLLVLGASGRVGHDVSGVAVRTGFELARAPRPLGGRLTLTAGPMFTSADGPGGNEARFDARGAFAIYYGRIKPDDPHQGEYDRTTIGVELFTSSIGIGNVHELLLGVGVTIGAYTGTKHGFQ